MPKKIQHTTKAHLISVPLPNHAATYTVISHQFIIDYAYQALANAGFGIVDEEYRCTADGQIAQGIYKLNFNNDPELSMMFAWTNSYNKQVKFKCVVGAYINQTGSVMISGEVGSWVRKHTGSADTETKATIDDYITNAHMYYTQLCSDKAVMETVSLNKRKQSQLLGVLFAEYEILTTEQASMIRDQMKRPLQVFANSDSLWAFYNFVTNALQSSHPKTWMEDQRILHYFIGTICDFSAPPQPVSAPPINLSAPVDPLDDNYGEPENQTNLLVQIAEATGDESVLAPQYPVTDEEAFNKVDNEEIVEILDLLLNAEDDDTYDDTSLKNDDTSIEVPDNQVVQEGSDFDIDLHQSEEITEDTNKAEEDVLTEDELAHQLYGVDNDIEVSIPGPCAAHDAETEREIEQENLTDIFPQDETVIYTDPVGNTFEAPIVIDTIDLNETTKASVVVVENVEDREKDIFAEADNFDLDFNDDTNSDPDSIPDFF